MEERTATFGAPILFPVPHNEFVNCFLAVSVDRDSTADLSAFYDGFVVGQIGDGGAVLVDIADGEAEAFGDASAGGNAEHEKFAVACLEDTIN